MAGPLKANVILVRCPKNKKPFGVRIEQRNGDWVRTWAFPIDERKAKHEGFDKNKISGSLNPVDDYPGCPYCGSIGFIVCDCGKLFCPCEIKEGDDGYGVAKCPWCGEVLDGLAGTDDDIEISGGGY